MPEREDDHEALAAGLDIDIGRRIKLRRIQLGLSRAVGMVWDWEKGGTRFLRRLRPVGGAGTGLGLAG